MKKMQLMTTQTVELRVPPQRFPIEDYLRTPDRFVQTLAPADRLQRIDTERYRLEIPAFSMLKLTICPVVDLAVWVDNVLMRGSALLRIDFDLPSPFSMMPKSVVEGAGNTLLKASLGAVKGQMLKELIRDYQAWALERSGAIAMGKD